MKNNQPDAIALHVGPHVVWTSWSFIQQHSHQLHTLLHNASCPNKPNGTFYIRRKSIDKENNVNQHNTLDEHDDWFFITKEPSCEQFELGGVSAAAFAILWQYWQSNDITVHEETATEVLHLCRWLSVENALVYTALDLVIQHQLTLAKWIDMVVYCTTLRHLPQQTALMHSLLQWLQTVIHQNGPEDMLNMPLERLAAIESEAVMVQIIMWLVNHVRHLGVWKQLVRALELWMLWTFQRPYVHHQLVSLVEVHGQTNAKWHPFVSIPLTHLNGMELYVRPHTLFAFGKYAFQVRFHVEWKRLIQWRITTIRPEDQECTRPFVVRGQLNLCFRCAASGPSYERNVSIRYTHAKHSVHQWKTLVASDVPLASEEDGIQFLRAMVTGQCFVWASPLCNLYHYLLLWTLFDQEEVVHCVHALKRLPFDTLLLVCQSDRLRIREGETRVVQCLHALLADDEERYSTEQMQRLLRTVRWKWVDLDAILKLLEAAPPTLRLYDMVHEALKNGDWVFPRKPFSSRQLNVQSQTRLIEFEIHAGDAGFSPT